MSRFTFDQKQRLGTAWSQYGDFYQPIGSKINVYQFRKVSGYMRMTTFGEQPISTSTQEYQQFTNIYTGKEPITVVWNGSTLLKSDPNGLTMTKEVKVGKYFVMYSTGANINVLETNEINLLGKDYVNTYINRDIVLESPDWEPTNDDMNEYVYLILDPINKSLQWLEIQQVIPVYNEETKEFQYSEVTFANVNLKYSKTGKSILDFIQFGAIGEGYCFPHEVIQKDGSIKVELDINKLLPNDKKQAQTVQIDFNGGAMLNSLVFLGREQETVDDQGNIKVNAPFYLFPYKVNFPKTSPFLYLQPNANSFALWNVLPVKDEVWESYKNLGGLWVSGYNVLETKQVLTGFKVDDEAARGTNPIEGNGYKYINWDDIRSINLNVEEVNFDYIPYCKTTSFKDKTFNYAEFLVFNYFVSFYDEAINFTFQETTKYKLTDVFGVFGSLVDILIGGLNVGWTSVSTLAPKQAHNFLIPCVTYLDGKSAFSAAAPLPSDILSDNKAQSIVPAATNVLTSWNVTLSDRIRDRSQTRENAIAGKGGNGIWKTIYLGQTKFEDGTWINDDHSPFEIDWATTTVISPSQQNGFIIDTVLFKVVSICDVKLSAFNRDGNAIYTSFMETTAKARNEITLWNNIIKFNYYEKFNTIGQLTWPETALSPIPPKVRVLLPELTGKKDIFQNSYFYLDTNQGMGFDNYFQTRILTTKIGPSDEMVQMWYDQSNQQGSIIHADFPSTLINDKIRECVNIDFLFDNYELELYESLIIEIESVEARLSYELTYDLSFNDQWLSPKETGQINISKTQEQAGVLERLFKNFTVDASFPACCRNKNSNVLTKVVGNMELPKIKLSSSMNGFKFQTYLKSGNVTYQLENSGLMSSLSANTGAYYVSATIKRNRVLDEWTIKNAWLVRKN